MAPGAAPPRFVVDSAVLLKMAAWNPCLRGTTPEQTEGWGWQSVHDPEMLPSVLERWKGSIATGEPFEMDFPLKGADGRFRMGVSRQDGERVFERFY